MNDVLPLTPYFGKLEVKRVYEFYDGPRLFLAENGVGTNYIAFWINTDQEGDEWLYASVTDERLNDLESSKLKLRDVFIYPNDLVFKVKTFFAEGTVSELIQCAVDKLSEDILPPTSYFIEGVYEEKDIVDNFHLDEVTELYIKNFKGRLTPSLAIVAKVSDAFSSLYNAVLRHFEYKNKSLTPIDGRRGSFILRLKSPHVSECLPVIKKVFDILNTEQNPFPHLLELGIDVDVVESLLEEIIDGKVRIQFSLENKFEAELNISKEKAVSALAHLKDQSSSYISSLLVPQANSLSKVFKVVELKSSGEFITPEKIGLTTERQVSYYLHAARMLGLISRSNAINSAGYQFINMNHDQRMNITAIRFESSDCGWAWLKWASKNSLDELEANSAKAFLIEKCPSLSEKTAERRAKTLAGWQKELSPFRVLPR